jgi:hypothetical protein
MTTHHTPRAVALAAALLAAGCGDSRGTVTGRVAYQGKALTSGSVVLYAADGQVYTGLIAPDGRYTIPNVPRGQLQATVRSHTAVPPGFGVGSSPPKGVNGPHGPTSGPPPRPVPAIPDRYGVPEESGLAVTVTAAQTDFDIELTR